ncbi:MAG: hypothetical protein HQL54_08025 [Magnetococcales bacterium]|nr:hypothetical protein [Magnetococcales bacterium]
MKKMLREITQNHPDHPTRRWFQSRQLDLFVWMDVGGINSFQLAYDRNTSNEGVLSWEAGGVCQHSRVDDGEGLPFKNQSPMLVANGVVPIDRIIDQFQACSETLPTAMRTTLLAILSEYRKNMDVQS